MRAHAAIRRSCLPHQPPVLDFHRERRAGDDSEKREERAERETCMRLFLAALRVQRVASR